MARVLLARQLLSDSGRVAAMSAANPEGHAFKNDGYTVLFVQNGGEIPAEITVRSGYYRGLKLEDRVVMVESGACIFLGPFDPKVYNQQDGEDAGHVLVDYAATDDVHVAVLQMPS